jgi:undecaprenyl-diphosphatase
MKSLDFAATVKIQERIDKSGKLRLAAIVGEVMEGSTFFASPMFSVIVIVFISLVSFYDWKRKKIRWVSLSIPFFFGLLILGEIYGKNVVHQPSPPIIMIKNPTTMFPKYYINESFSYPSGHSARAVFISLITYFLLVHQNNFTSESKRKLGTFVVLLGYVMLVSISRIYLGHHWLSDVLGGSLLGLGFGLLTLAVNSLIIDKQ